MKGESQQLSCFLIFKAEQFSFLHCILQKCSVCLCLTYHHADSRSTTESPFLVGDEVTQK